MQASVMPPAFPAVYVVLMLLGIHPVPEQDVAKTSIALWVDETRNLTADV